MRKVILVALAVFAMSVAPPHARLLLADDTATARAGLTWPSDLPVYDHVVIVVEENKNYEEIIGKPEAPYINSVLRAEGANFTKMFAEEHSSQGNYFWLFSGSNHGIGFKDVIPSAANNAAYPFTASNLAEQLIVKGKTFKGYSESLPAIGFEGEFSPDHLYARKHVPWVSFKNVPHGMTADSVHLRFSDFPTDFTKLPTVSIVIPNLKNDMHDGNPSVSIPHGDAWLKTHLDPYYQWAKSHNSLLILTFDENNDRSHFHGLTNPKDMDPNLEHRHDKINRAVTIFAGAHIKPGDYVEGNGVTHITVLRTLEAMYRLPKSGAQQPHAVSSGIGDDQIITDVFQ